MLESIYRAAGYKTGLYTSPHLVSFRERIQVNRELIAEMEVVRLTECMQALLRKFPAEQPPTFFEVITVMALEHFARARCDIILLETGLGGRLDATNIVTPIATVITPIAFDHQQYLGETLAQIATEKSGILKQGIPALSAPQLPEARAVLEQTGPITFVEGEHDYRPHWKTPTPKCRPCYGNRGSFAKHFADKKWNHRNRTSQCSLARPRASVSTQWA